VVFLVQRFPGYGGAEEYVSQLTRRLAESGVMCTIFTSDLDKRQVTGLSECVKVVKFPVFLKFGEYALWSGLFKTLLGTKADVFHVNTYGYFHTDLVCLLHRLKKFNVVLTSHGFHGLDAFLNRRRNNATRSLLGTFRVATRPFYDFTLGFNEIASADALVALSENDVDFFRWMGAEAGKIHEISLGVKDIFFEGGDEELKGTLRERFCGDPVILSVGELSWVKRKDIPLRALASLVKEYPKAKLVYVGRDGGQYAYLRELVTRLGLEKNVLFEGYVSSDQLVNYYAVADVLVHTSSAEGLSTVILEALSSGLPVVSTPAGGNAQLLQKSKAGIVVPFNDPNSVYLAINKILGDKSLQRFLSANGKGYAVNNLKWAEIAQKYLSLYQSLLKET
jgi:glycosyltransferase involved in cell wall biosynthesis